MLPDDVAHHLDRRPEQFLLEVFPLVVATQLRCHRCQQGTDGPAACLQLIGEFSPCCDMRLYRLEQQLEGPADRFLGGLAGENGDGFGQPGSNLSDQPGLAHPCLSGDQRHAGVVVGRHHGEQSLEFVLAPDHGRARDRDVRRSRLSGYDPFIVS